MLEDEPTEVMPPRSRLFGLPLAGDDGPSREALLDFAQRLSHEHHLRVRDLFAKVILPEARLDGAFYVPGHFAAHAVRGCNGWSKYACSFVAAMQRLTGRAEVADGALSRWAGLLADQGYVARLRRWCSHCLQSQQDRGFYSFSLLWAFEPVSVCPVHRVALQEACGRCGLMQPVISDFVVRGLCAHCRFPLGIASKPLIKLAGMSPEVFKAQAMAGMIDAREQAELIATEDVYKLRLQEVAAEIAGGSILRLEKMLNFSYMTLAKSGRHTLGLFLEVMYRLNVKPVPFLSGVAKLRPMPKRWAIPYRTHRRLSADEVTEIRQRADRRLAVALKNDQRVTTRLEFVRDLGISNSYLQSRFPEVQHALRAHNDGVRPTIHCVLWQHRAGLIDNAMRNLIASREALTASAIGKALIENGLHRRNPEVRRLSFEAIKRALADSALLDSTQAHISGRSDDET